MNAVHCNYVIHHFHIKCTLFTPQNFAQPFSSISLGTTVLPWTNWKKKWLCKILGVNRLHCGLCEMVKAKGGIHHVLDLISFLLVL